MIGKKALESLEVQIPGISTQQRIIELSRLADREQTILESLAVKRKRLVENKLLQAITTSQLP